MAASHDFKPVSGEGDVLCAATPGGPAVDIDSRSFRTLVIIDNSAKDREFAGEVENLAANAPPLFGRS